MDTASQIKIPSIPSIPILEVVWEEIKMAEHPYTCRFDQFFFNNMEITDGIWCLNRK